MTDYFGEKSTQVEPGAMSAFGIQIHSRYSQAYELVEMLKFAHAAASTGLAHYVTEVFYDSKASMCSVTFAPIVQEDDAVWNQIFAIAKTHISHLYWHDNQMYYHDEEPDCEEAAHLDDAAV